jgi:hypothetical protein
MTRDKSPTCQRLGHLTGQPGPIGQQAQTRTAGMSHHTGPITGYRQASRPRSTLHLRSAFRFEDLEKSQSQISLPGRHFRVSTRVHTDQPCMIRARGRQPLLQVDLFMMLTVTLPGMGHDLPRLLWPTFISNIRALADPRRDALCGCGR